jgi:hypothetical protein
MPLNICLIHLRNDIKQQFGNFTKKIPLKNKLCKNSKKMTLNRMFNSFLKK